MAAPVIIELAPPFQPTFGKFAAAVTEKPERFHECFGKLLQYLDQPTIEKLARAQATDVATTILAYLPADAQRTVADLLKSQPDLKQQVLDAITEAQRILRQVLAETAADKGQHLRKL